MMLTPSILRTDFVDNVFDDFFNNSFWKPVVTGKSYNSMNTDIRESEDGFQVEMELPGFAKEDVKAALKDGYLTVTAEHSENKDEKDENQKYIRRERYSGHYQRSFYVGDTLTEEDIKASFKDGILTMMIPKKQPEAVEESGKFISIEG